MDIQKAAQATLACFANDWEDAKRPKRCPGNECHASHLAWMLKGIEMGFIEGEKAHRWLGFVQGVLVSNGMTTVEVLRAINQEA